MWLDLLKPYLGWLRVIAVAAAVGAFLYGWHKAAEHYRKQGRAEVQAQFDAYRQQVTDNALKVAALTERSAQAMQRAFSALENDRETVRLDLQRARADVARQLRERPAVAARCAQAPGDPGPRIEGTGYLVSERDAEHLVALAEAADQVRADLATCIAKYDAVKQQTDALLERWGDAP
jgi:hypothetical protein